MTRWLSVIGIGEDGYKGLGTPARTILANAEFIIGGERHLALLGSTRAETAIWPTPFQDGVDAVVARRPRQTCVLASGDPFFYGVGSVLARHISPSEMVTLPAPSSLSLAAARLGWALQDCTIVSLHGRAFEQIVPQLQAKAKLLILSWDGATPGLLAKLLVDRGMGQSRFVVLEALGGDHEAIIESTADSFTEQHIDRLNLVAVDIVAAPCARIIPRAPGLPDDWFESDGQLTKREIRALTLSALAPRRGELLWDIGAGAGSVGIEWMLADRHNRAIAIEARSDRAARIARNAAALGVPDLEIVTGEAPAALAGLKPPDAAFIGGGGPQVIRRVHALLPSGCRLVVNAVALETQQEIEQLHAAFGGDLIAVQTERAEKLGRYRTWRPGLRTVQWVMTKP